jgi:superfamily II RNA helicase
VLASSWLRSCLHSRTKQKDIYVISTPKRPVPLEHYLYVKKEIYKIVGPDKKFLTAGCANWNPFLENQPRRLIHCPITGGRLPMMLSTHRKSHRRTYGRRYGVTADKEVVVHVGAISRAVVVEAEVADVVQDRPPDTTLDSG